MVATVDYLLDELVVHGRQEFLDTTSWLVYIRPAVFSGEDRSTTAYKPRLLTNLPDMVLLEGDILAKESILEAGSHVRPSYKCTAFQLSGCCWKCLMTLTYLPLRSIGRVLVAEEKRASDIVQSRWVRGFHPSVHKSRVTILPRKNAQRGAGPEGDATITMQPSPVDNRSPEADKILRIRGLRDAWMSRLLSLSSVLYNCKS